MTQTSAQSGLTPRTIFILICVAQVMLWTLSPSIFFLAPPLDVGENMIWGKEWQLGFAKHPPLQTWVTEIAYQLSGGRVEAVYLISQLGIFLNFLALFLLAKDVASERVGALAVAIYALVFYCGVPTVQFNANVIQMPIWALAGLFFWRAIDRKSVGYWVALGVMLALGLYAKYSVIFLVFSLILAGLSMQSGRDSLKTAGPYISAAVALALSLPHLIWLHQSGYLPLEYAVEQTKHLIGIQRLIAQMWFFAGQILIHFFAIVFVIILWPGFRRSVAGTDANRFVGVMAVWPLLSMAIYSAIQAEGLDDMWGTQSVTWISLWVAMHLKPSSPGWRIKIAGAFWIVIFLLGPIGNGVYSRFGPDFGKHPFSNGWPAEALTEQMVAKWDEIVGGAPKIVAGNTHTSGMIVYNTRGRPSGFHFADYKVNPWITPERVKAEGVLFLWQGASNPFTTFEPFEFEGVATAMRGKIELNMSYAIKAPVAE